MDILEYEADELERTAEWRQQKANEYPEDERNEHGAEQCRVLSQQLRTLRAVLTTDDLGLVRRVHELRSRIGFDTMPDISQYVRELIRLGEDYQWTTSAPVGSEVI